MPNKLAEAIDPLIAYLAGAWVARLWLVVAKAMRPRLPPESLSPIPPDEPDKAPRGIFFTVAPKRISVAIRSSMPSGPATPPGPMRSIPLRTSVFSMLTVASKSSTSCNCSVTTPLARVISAVPAKRMSTCGAPGGPVDTTTPLKVLPLRLISTAMSVDRSVRPSTPTSSATPKVPLTANLARACTASA